MLSDPAIFQWGTRSINKGLSVCFKRPGLAIIRKSRKSRPRCSLGSESDGSQFIAEEIMNPEKIGKKLKALLAAFFLVFLSSCLEIEHVELSSADLVVPEGIEGRWVIKYYDSKNLDDIAQIQKTEDATLKVTVIDAGTGAENRKDWSMRLIKTLSEHIFIVVMEDQKNGEAYLGILERGGKNNTPWSFFMMQENKEISHQLVAEWLKEQFGLRYTKDQFDMKTKIEGTVNARTLRELVFAESKSTRHFVSEPWSIGLIKLPEGHSYQTRLDRALGTSGSPGVQSNTPGAPNAASNVRNCGARRCATLNGHTIYRTRIPKEWWYWPDGQVVTPESWPKE